MTLIDLALTSNKRPRGEGPLCWAWVKSTRDKDAPGCRDKQCSRRHYFVNDESHLSAK